jgi:hypothetical protein
VVTAVATREQLSLDELEPLYDYIDPEALDTLFESLNDGSSRAGGRVSFAFSGYQVTVTNDGEVELESSESALH